MKLLCCVQYQVRIVRYENWLLPDKNLRITILNHLIYFFYLCYCSGWPIDLYGCQVLMKLKLPLERALMTFDTFPSNTVTFSYTTALIHVKPIPKSVTKITATLHCFLMCVITTVYIVNSLWPSDALWCHRSGSMLKQVNACCLMAPSHYLHQYWLVINRNLRNLTSNKHFVLKITFIRVLITFLKVS